MSGLLFLDYKKDSKYFEGMFNIKKNMKTAVTKLETLAPSLGKTLTPSLGKTKQIIWSWLGGSPAFLYYYRRGTYLDPWKKGGGEGGVFFQS